MALSPQIIIEVKAVNTSPEEIRQQVTRITGCVDLFFCPPIGAKKPYQGHVHLFPPYGAQYINKEKIILP